MKAEDKEKEVAKFLISDLVALLEMQERADRRDLNRRKFKIEERTQDEVLEAEFIY